MSQHTFLLVESVTNDARVFTCVCLHCTRTGQDREFGMGAETCFTLDLLANIDDMCNII